MKSPSSTRIWIYVVLLCSISCTSNEGGQGSDESVNGLVFAQCESTPPECSLPCGMDDVDDDERGEIREEGCWITGGGHLGDANARGGAGKNRQDSFGFNAMGTKQGTVRGQIQNTTHLGDVFHGQATWLECWRDGGEGPEVPKATRAGIPSKPPSPIARKAVRDAMPTRSRFGMRPALSSTSRARHKTASSAAATSRSIRPMQGTLTW